MIENYCCYYYIMLPSLLFLQMCYGIFYCCIYVVIYVLFGILDIKAFEFNVYLFFFSICTLCTLLNEDDKSETEIGAYKPLGFLSHLQYKCYLCENASILIFGSNIYRHIYICV